MVMIFEFLLIAVYSLIAYDVITFTTITTIMYDETLHLSCYVYTKSHEFFSNRLSLSLYFSQRFTWSSNRVSIRRLLLNVIHIIATFTSRPRNGFWNYYLHGIIINICSWMSSSFEIFISRHDGHASISGEQDELETPSLPQTDNSFNGFFF